MKSTRKAFTLVELLVVLGILAMLIGAFTLSASDARKRAQLQKAQSEVRTVSQAILAYENYDKNHELPSMTDRDADADSMGFLLGRENADSGGKIPPLLMASLRNGGKMLDPWNTPYKISIRPGKAAFNSNTASASMRTGYFLPNFYRLSQEERQ